MAAEEDEPAADSAATRKGGLAQEAARRIRAMIVYGDIPPGERLREAFLCERLGMSRTPVREALRTLAAEGLVNVAPNRSVTVAPLDAAETQDLIVVFAELEALSGELAGARATDDDVAEIGALLTRMIDAHAAGDRAAYLTLNQAIHRRTVEIAANAVLLATWRSLEPRVERARALPNRDNARWTEALLEHTKMYAALAARDGAALSTLTREHFLNALPYLRRSGGGATD